MADNSVLSTGCGFPCNESKIYMPWSCFEQIKNSAGEQNPIFGLMYGIKDKNIRRKLGYRTGKHRSPKRIKPKYKRNLFSNKEQNFGNKREWIASSTDGEISPVQKASDASIKEKFKITDQKSSSFAKIQQNLHYHICFFSCRNRRTKRTKIAKFDNISRHQYFK
jgi:hypothetical protein